MLKEKFRIFQIVFFSMMIFSSIAHADKVYFKNGNQLEGQVEKTSKGIWVEGLLFREDEIERIEKTQVKDEKKSWYENIFSGFGSKKQNKPALPSAGSARVNPPTSLSSSPPERASSTQTQTENERAPVNPFQQILAPENKEPKQDLLGGSLKLYQQNMGNYAGMMEHAQRLQQQANDRQRLMQEEIRRMEEGEGGEYDPSLYQEEENQRRGSRTSYDRGSGGSSYPEVEYKEKPTKSTFSKGIKFGTDGEATWE
ncbi:MAG TPA: hypothetical protein DD723_00330 [Candidatus Omnitrophica bacterium]|nr:MAG: hypothetical protein A2Z81_04600 [Omnitrophica WOR_2 bacterium GWA2_45_18]HBR13978.1 hypothetical protein [Candidatus Omnitrophota bacterium]